MVLDVEMSEEAAVQDCMIRRKCQGAVVRGFVNDVRMLLAEDDQARLIDCKQLVENLTIAKDKQNLIVNELGDLAAKYHLDSRDVEDLEHSLSLSVQQALVEANEWIVAVKALKARSEATKDHDVAHVIGGSKAEPLVTRNFEEIADHQASIIDKQGEQMAALEEQLRRVQSEMFELTSARQEIDSLKKTLVKQQEENDSQRTFFQSTIHRLKEDAKSSVAGAASDIPNTSSPNRDIKGRRSAEFGDISRVGINQDDLLAISHVMQKTNCDMVKSIMHDNRQQQERFYTTMQSPKVELKKFEGDVTKYQAFINRFDDIVGNTDCTYSVKLNTLLQYCGDSVLKHLSCCEYQLPKEGYHMARKILREKYGKPHLIVNAWLERLMEYQKLNKADIMQQFVSDLKACRKTLETMNCLGELDNTDKKRVILSKLPTYIQNRWRKCVRRANEEGTTATLEELIDMIANAADELSDPVYGAESLAKVAGMYEPKPSKQMPVRSTKKSFATTIVDKSEVDSSKQAKSRGAALSSKPSVREPCVCCQKEHFTRKCDIFKAMDSKTKLQFARDQKMCLLCLSQKHDVKDCVFTWRCQKVPCNGKHNNVFHEALTAEGNNGKSTADKVLSMMTQQKDTDTDEESLPSMKLSGVNRFAMPLTPVFIYGPNGLVPTHAFHDTGGGFSIITKRAKDLAGLPTMKRIKFDAATIFSDKALDVDVVTFLVKGKGCDGTHLVFNAIVLDQEILDEKYAAILGKMGRWPHLKDINMPLHDTNRIDILLGQDNAHVMDRCDRVGISMPYSPYAIKTPIGWTVHGYNIDEKSVGIFDSRNIVQKLGDIKIEVAEKAVMPSMNRDDVLVAAVDRLTAIEQVPEANLMSPENQAIINYWEKETRLIDGHVEVPIPFKGGKLELPNNYSGALKRLGSLERRLNKDESLKKMFISATHENFDAGYAENVTKEAIPGHDWYIPTQPVVSDKKPGRCRIVGDASYWYHGACLNEAVSQGPNNTAHVLDILLKFRKYRFVVIGDIKAMYNQVKVPVEQRSCLKFLWWEEDDVGGKVSEHQMTTHMFGGRWSAAVAIFALKWLANHLRDEYCLEAIDTVLKHFYVDDLLRPFMDEVVGAQTMKEVLHLLSRASFRLTKISSNSDVIMREIPVVDRAVGMDVLNLELEGGPSEQTLGCVWKRVDDTLGFASVQRAVVYTRRGVLSTMSSLFDPLGLVAPFVLIARILLQEICRLGYSWDEPIASELCTRWDAWLAELEMISAYTVPRWLGFSNQEGYTYQIHNFMDASEKGYGWAGYLCIIDQDGIVKDVNLISAKAKVTPVKVVTIPRLELCAAVIAVKMNRILEEYLDEQLKPSVYWSDSTIVLYYLNGKAWQYRTFVANRVVYLQEHTTINQWRHIDSGRNIADIASRGVTGAELTQNEEWLKGPEFLMTRELWPEPFHFEVDPGIEKNLEMKKSIRMSYRLVQVDNSVSLDLCKLLITHYSRWNKLLRAVCFLRRSMSYLQNHGKKFDNGPVTAGEIEKAECKVLQMTQDIYITESQRASKIFEKLFPFFRGQLTRVGGRLTNASLAFEEKHPVVFPQCPVQDVYIYHVHERVGHGGIDRTFYEARKKYWLLGGKKSVKKVVDKCVICQKTRGRFQRQLMAPLPSFRVEEGKIPFQNVGVDFFGPYYVKHGRGLIKRYACMYTDLLMRACHVEVVPDLTSSAFLNSLQRFISRRGRPALLVSDNGKSLGKFMSEEGIRWIFNTPTASHHGGAWERMIRIFRNLMMVVMRNQPLTEDSLRTFTCIIEGIMNSRPLTKLTEDPGDPLPLTPEHLLNLRSTQGLVGDFTQGESLRHRWRQVQYLGNQFWKRWVSEYLRSLQKRDKWTKDMPNVKVGDVVLILDQSMPRTRWPLGLVIETVIGRDNKVRSVRMRTERGEMVRPITKVVQLECT